jgi:phenylalanyl-tRNA synthetase beta chain
VKVPLSWLREFVAVRGSAEEIARTMSVRGFAVESIEHCGKDLSAGASAKADTVIDFEVTANRPDCMSIAGIAREVATAYGLPLKAAGRPAAALALRTSAARGAGAADTRMQGGGRAKLTITIDNPELCSRYAGAVADVTVGPSPAWMQARLQAAGIRPISNIVDVTNYVLLELGQPMHAFDFSKLTGARIRVRTARSGETLKTLDGQVRELSKDMLVIADAERPVAIAGVMGGADSEVTATTRTIVLESAHFNPISVRRTSKKRGLKTEASMRFERGTDPALPVVAMKRAVALLELIGAGRASRNVIDRYPRRAKPAVLRLRRAKISGLLGLAVPDKDVRRILKSLGFTLRKAADGWRVTVPTRRVDATREADLIEEVARHYGFDRIPATFPVLDAAPKPIDPRITRARQMRTVLTATGFFEAVTFGWVSKAAAAPFAADGDVVPIANPLSENFAVLRPSALPGLIDAVAHNRRREQHDVRFFEIGARFSRKHGEQQAVACAWAGAATGEHWGGGARPVDFFDIKGVAERICEAVGVGVDTAPHQEKWLVPGQSAALLSRGKLVARFGQLAKDVVEAHGLPTGETIYVAEVDLDALEDAAAGRDLRVQPLPRHPSVTRDISILVNDLLPAADVRRTIRDAAPATLVSISEFDRYQGKGIPANKVSLSLRLTFRASDRTLTDAEVQNAMTDILTALTERHSAVQR